MVQRSQTVFYIERLQPDWLPGEQRWAFGLVGGLFSGLVFGLGVGLVDGLFSGLGFGLGGGLVGGLVGGLSFELVLVSGLSSYEIICAENIIWSWPKQGDLGFGLGFGLVSGLVSGLGGWLVFGLVNGLVVGLVSWLVVGLVFSLVKGLSVGEIETRDIPNQGIHRSAWNALGGGLGFGLVGGLVGGLAYRLFSGLVGGLVFGLFSGLVGGLVVGLNTGGQACLKHLVLRLLLVRSGSIPWDYVKFLDYAAERILLRKVGGGYIFIHRMLLEYFAARYDESSVEATPNAEPSQIVIGM